MRTTVLYIWDEWRIYVNFANLWSRRVKDWVLNGKIERQNCCSCFTWATVAYKSCEVRMTTQKVARSAIARQCRAGEQVTQSANDLEKVARRIVWGWSGGISG